MEYAIDTKTKKPSKRNPSMSLTELYFDVD